MNEPIKCVAVDDEPLALDIIEKFCQRIGNIELQKFNDPRKGLDAILRSNPDIVFLDIEMDGITDWKLQRNCLGIHVLYSRPPICGMRLKDSISMPWIIFTSHFRSIVSRLLSPKLYAVSAAVICKRRRNAS